MRIALISFEYPPDTAVGGIATYVEQAAQMLSKRGNEVEVFCASSYREGSSMEGEIFVHRVKTCNRLAFRKLILSVFAFQHNLKKFDIAESPEYNADGFEIMELFPKLPIAIKLHTPSFLIEQLNNPVKPQVSLLLKLRVFVAGWRRLKKPNIFWKYNNANDPEYCFTKKGDVVITPSISLGEIVIQKWNIRRKQVVHLPYPFIPSPILSSIPCDTKSNTITYFGRLEIRKGVMIFAKVIPALAKQFPYLKYRFVGKNLQSHVKGKTMRDFLSEQLEEFKDRIEYIDHVEKEEIPNVLSQTDICVFPSLWENFPNVCLEAMSAGRGIVASKEGGMKDMLEDQDAGILVNPKSEEEIVNAVAYLVTNRKERIAMGERARNRVFTHYSSENIGKMTEEVYEKVIKNKGVVS